MAKYYGIVAYTAITEIAPGVWSKEPIEREVFGDIYKDSTKTKKSDRLNDDVIVQMKISFLADPYALTNYSNIIYATNLGTKWKVKSTEVQHPRLILTLGEIYNPNDSEYTGPIGDDGQPTSEYFKWIGDIEFPKSYVKNEMGQYGNALYICTVTHEATEFDTDKWDLMLASSSGTGGGLTEEEIVEIIESTISGKTVWYDDTDIGGTLPTDPLPGNEFVLIEGSTFVTPETEFPRDDSDTGTEFPDEPETGDEFVFRYD